MVLVHIDWLLPLEQNESLLPNLLLEPVYLLFRQPSPSTILTLTLVLTSATLTLALTQFLEPITDQIRLQN